MTPPSMPERWITTEAARWLVEIREHAMDEEGVRRFEEWRAADHRHARVFAELSMVWDDLPQAISVGHPPTVASNDDEPSGRRDDRSAHVRRRRIGAGLTALAACAAAILFVAGLPKSQGEIATGIGEIRTVGLPDGSAVTLGPATRLTYRFTTSLRHVTLAYGETLFDVAKNPLRPFVVDTGLSAIRVVGTQFDAKRMGSVATVEVLRGVVQIRRKDGQERLLRTLGKGESTRIVRDTHGAPLARADALRSESAAALGQGWRQGWLVYDDARLGEVLNDLNRYYRPGIRFAEAKLVDLRVTASFRTGDIPRFVASLDRLYPIRVTRRQDGRFLMQPK